VPEATQLPHDVAGVSSKSVAGYNHNPALTKIIPANPTTKAPNSTPVVSRSTDPINANLRLAGFYLVPNQLASPFQVNPSSARVGHLVHRIFALLISRVPQYYPREFQKLCLWCSTVYASGLCAHLIVSLPFV
jgi:hypothetical protein